MKTAVFRLPRVTVVRMRHTRRRSLIICLAQAVCKSTSAATAPTVPFRSRRLCPFAGQGTVRALRCLVPVAARHAPWTDEDRSPFAHGDRHADVDADFPCGRPRSPCRPCRPRTHHRPCTPACALVRRRQRADQADRGIAQSQRPRRIPHGVRLLPHGIRRPDGLSGRARKVAPARVLRQHRHECVLDRDVHRRQRRFHLPRRHREPQRLLGARDHRHTHRHAGEAGAGQHVLQERLQRHPRR